MLTYTGLRARKRFRKYNFLTVRKWKENDTRRKPSICPCRATLRRYVRIYRGGQEKAVRNAYKPFVRGA